MDSRNSNPIQTPEMNRESLQVTAIAFLVLFCIVGMALWGLPFYYDFMVQQFGWTRAQVTSGNALLVGRLRDTTGSYTGGFLVLIGMAALSAVAVSGLPKGRKPA